MGELHDRVAEAADRIEAELRRLGWWDVPEPSADEMAFRQAFGADTMPFPRWLRFVLLPRVRTIVATEGEFPTSSSVGTYAVRELGGMPEAEPLVSLLAKFDGLFRADDPVMDSLSSDELTMAMGMDDEELEAFLDRRARELGVDQEHGAG